MFIIVSQPHTILVRTIVIVPAVIKIIFFTNSQKLCIRMSVMRAHIINIRLPSAAGFIWIGNSGSKSSRAGPSHYKVTNCFSYSAVPCKNIFMKIVGIIRPYTFYTACCHISFGYNFYTFFFFYFGKNRTVIEYLHIFGCRIKFSCFFIPCCCSHQIVSE